MKIRYKPSVPPPHRLIRKTNEGAGSPDTPNKRQQVLPQKRGEEKQKEINKYIDIVYNERNTKRSKWCK